MRRSCGCSGSRIAAPRRSEMPSPEFLDELAHELKDQFASNSDLRNESELFYEFHGRDSRNAKDLDAKVITTNDDTVCDDAESPA